MSEKGRLAPVDYDTLADVLTGIAYPMRLELLEMLRFPKFLSEIHLQPRRSWGGETPERPAARQTVQAHLDKLEDAGLVRVEAVPDGARTINRYSVDHTRLYALVEDLRRVSALQPGNALADDATGTLAGGRAPPTVTGPRLVLVHGLYEGKTFPLTPATATEGRWTIGRRRGIAASLDYDPFVSLDNAIVTREGEDAFRVADVDGSKNGTLVNWALLRRGEARLLRPGDVVGVGRSLLTFAL